MPGRLLVWTDSICTFHLHLRCFAAWEPRPSEETLQQRAIKSARTSLELGRSRVELSEAAQTVCDRMRLTRAWSRELRRRRPSWGARCRKPFSADDRGWTVNYLPAGEAVTRETRTIHQACATAWIIGRVRPEPWLESFRWFTTAQRTRPGLAWVAVADCPCAGYFLGAPLLSRRLGLGVDRESLSHRIRDLRATGSEAWVSTRHGTPEDPSVVVRDHRPDRAP